MRKLKLLETYSYVDKWERKVYHRVYHITDYPDRVFVEQTSYSPKFGMWRVWYCPTVPEYKGRWNKNNFMRLGGNASLKYWFDKYINKG